jgi:YidC/Oxa1 family membrane protein insertase
MVMPPPADEQAAMQAKMMQYMMIFMGVMFFKVASGLCIYFIASSLWGVAERKLLPKTMPAGDAKTIDVSARALPSSGNGRGGGQRKKPSGKK